MDSAIFIIEMLLAGVGVGLISNALGLGGGILMVPVFLQVIDGMDSKTATGTSLFIIIFVAAANAWRLTRAWQRIPWHLILALGAGSIVGGYAAAWITGRMSEQAVLAIFIALLALLGLRTFALRIAEVKPEDIRRRDLPSVAIGLFSGTVGGATGTGGGLVLVPTALIAGVACNAQVVGISNLVMVLTAIAGSVARLNAEQIFPLAHTVGQVYFPAVLPVFIGAQIASPWGSRLNSWLTLPRRKVALGLTLLLIAAQLLFRLLG